MNRLSILIILILVIILFQRECSHKNYINQAKLSYSEDISTYQRKDGVRVSTIKSLEIENYKLAVNLDSTSESVKALVKEAMYYKKKLKQATHIESTTNINESANTVVIHSDTVYNNDTVYIHPQYSHKMSNKWVDIDLTADKDTFKVNLNIHNGYTVSHNYKKKGLFKKKLYVDVTPTNPYTSLDDVKTIEIKPKKSKIILGPMVGISLTGQPLIGIGVTYPLIRF